MGVLMPETCWVSKKKNKNSKWHLVGFLFFSYHKMHGPINIHILDRICCTCITFYIPPWWGPCWGQNMYKEYKWQVFNYYWLCNLFDRTLCNKFSCYFFLLRYLLEQRASDVGQVLRTPRNNAHRNVKLACSSQQLVLCYPLLHTLDLSEKELSWWAGTLIKATVTVWFLSLKLWDYINQVRPAVWSGRQTQAFWTKLLPPYVGYKKIIGFLLYCSRLRQNAHNMTPHKLA